MITSYSGFLAQAGDSMDKGIRLYGKLHEKELPPGIAIEIIRRVEKLDGRLANVEIATILMVKDPWKELNPAK